MFIRIVCLFETCGFDEYSKKSRDLLGYPKEKFHTKLVNETTPDGKNLCIAIFWGEKPETPRDKVEDTGLTVNISR